MSELDSETYIAIKKLAKALRTKGVKKVIDKLDELQAEESYDAHKELITFIVKETSSKFQVRPENLKKKNIRGDAAEARFMCFVLLDKHLDLSQGDIARLFGGRSHTVVSIAIKKYRDLNAGIKEEKKLIEIFEEVDDKIEAQRELLFLKHSK